MEVSGLTLDRSLDHKVMSVRLDQLVQSVLQVRLEQLVQHLMSQDRLVQQVQLDLQVHLVDRLEQRDHL
jgi:hypothetical protein